MSETMAKEEGEVIEQVRQAASGDQEAARAVLAG